MSGNLIVVKAKPHYIKELVAQGENQQLDFKFEISDARKIARTLSAFANTDGGKLLIGVKDNGVISGIRTDEEEYMIESAAHLFCKPRVDYTIKKWNVDGRWVLEVNILKSKSKPHYAKDEKGNWIAYVRVADQNFQANRLLIRVWNNEINKKDVLLKYSDEVKKLVDFLEDRPHITLSKFTRIAHITRKVAENILVKMISMNVIDIELTEKAVFFKLKSSITNRDSFLN